MRRTAAGLSACAVATADALPCWSNAKTAQVVTVIVATEAACSSHTSGRPARQAPVMSKGVAQSALTA